MAERALTAAMLAAMQSGALRPALFYEGEFDSAGSPAYLRLWTGVGNIDWNGYTWTGGTKLLGISPIKETINLQAVGFQVSMAGIASADVSRALQSMRKKRSGKLWLGLFPTQSLWALQFDGLIADGGHNQCVTVPDNADFQFGAADSFSLEYWINYGLGVRNPYWAMGKGNGYGPVGWGVANWTTGDPVNAQFYMNDGAHTTPYLSVSIGAFPRGEWHHVIVVVDRTAQRTYTYKDGAISATSGDLTPLGSMAAVGSPLTLGCMGGSYVFGSLDGVRLYKDRALSASEVSEHYQGVFRDDTGIVGKWDFEEGSGTVAADTSGNGNDGTLVNSPAWVSGSGKIDLTKLIADPFVLRRGRFNIAPIQDDGDTATITAQYEDRLILLETPVNRRYTHEDQQLRYPGDKGFDQVPELQNAQDVWGA